jgi:hypothetical protein
VGTSQTVALANSARINIAGVVSQNANSLMAELSPPASGIARHLSLLANPLLSGLQPMDSDQQLSLLPHPAVPSAYSALNPEFNNDSVLASPGQFQVGSGCIVMH